MAIGKIERNVASTVIMGTDTSPAFDREVVNPTVSPHDVVSPPFEQAINKPFLRNLVGTSHLEGIKVSTLVTEIYSTLALVTFTATGRPIIVFRYLNKLLSTAVPQRIQDFVQRVAGDVVLP